MCICPQLERPVYPSYTSPFFKGRRSRRDKGGVIDETTCCSVTLPSIIHKFQEMRETESSKDRSTEAAQRNNIETGG